MNLISRIAKDLFPNVFAPSALRGMPPSLSGIIARIKSPVKNVNHPIFGKYSVTVISRDEERRLAAQQFQEMISKYPPGSYHEVSLEETSSPFPKIKDKE